jgi:hypothetical protein
MVGEKNCNRTMTRANGMRASRNAIRKSCLVLSFVRRFFFRLLAEVAEAAGIAEVAEAVGVVGVAETASEDRVASRPIGDALEVSTGGFFGVVWVSRPSAGKVITRGAWGVSSRVALTGDRGCFSCDTLVAGAAPCARSTAGTMGTTGVTTWAAGITGVTI